MSAVAVIGLGAMGTRMARRLVETGHDVVVWNRTRARMVPLIDLGATPAETPAEAAGLAGAVLTMVSDPGALREVTEGPSGIAAGAGSSTTIIQMSTVGPAAVSRLEAVLPAEVALIDAPVLGSLPEAESGSLKIFVGAPASLVARWTPLLSALGSPIHVGPLGTGTAAKLVANATLIGVLNLLGEAVALGRRLGLPNDVVFDVLSATPLAAQAERRRHSIESGQYPVRFALSLACKDAGLILDAAAESGADLRLLRAAGTWLADADGAGRGDQDYAAVLAHIQEAVQGGPRSHLA